MDRSDHVADYLAWLARAKGISVERLGLVAQDAGLENAEPPAKAQQRSLASEGIDRIARGMAPTTEQTSALEAIILPKIRPVLDVVDGTFRTEHPLWQHLNDENGRARGALLKAIPSVGRIELPGNLDYPYGGTGFVVGKNLVMTNRHVAAIFADGLGSRRLSFKPGHRAGIDFLRELERPTGPTLAVKRIVMVHPYWDMALLEVDGLTDEQRPLDLAAVDPGPDAMIEVAGIGYPAFDDRNDATVQNDLFRRVFGVKRVQPGTLGGRRDAESFGKLVPALRHNCSTLGGNSGSALVELENGRVVALHFGGRYADINYSVPVTELARDKRVVDAGVNIIGANTASGSPPWNDWWTAADDQDAPERPQRPRSPRPQSAPTTLASLASPARLNADGSLTLVVPLHITLSLGGGADVTVSTPTGGGGAVDDGVEKLATPWHDDQYATRTGYDENFLDPKSKKLKVPAPRPAEASVVARAKDGSEVLHYQNFSIVMHRHRRIALFTASNVTAEAPLKKPEAGRQYSRKALSGLGENDQEKWFIDARLDEHLQLPDVFYTRDRGAFDKGHIVRREDVAWGPSYELLRRANGDTYHVTNCSPQVARFNRSNFAKDNWGSLENHVLKGAAQERYCQFAGPVFDDVNDRVFEGTSGGGTRVDVKIPSRYWKVIVARTNQGLASFGFVLEQDLAQVQFEEEFLVPTIFARFMQPLTELQALAGVRFDPLILNADRYDTTEGLEVAFNAGVKRRANGVIETFARPA